MALAKNLTEPLRPTWITVLRLGTSERTRSLSDLSFEKSENEKPNEYWEEQCHLLWCTLLWPYDCSTLDRVSYPAQGMYVRLEVITAVSHKKNVTPCSWIEIKRRFGVTWFRCIRIGCEWLCIFRSCNHPFYRFFHAVWQTEYLRLKSLIKTVLHFGSLKVRRQAWCACPICRLRFVIVYLILTSYLNKTTSNGRMIMNYEYWWFGVKRLVTWFYVATVPLS